MAPAASTWPAVDALKAISLGASWEPASGDGYRYGRQCLSESYASAQSDFEYARRRLPATMAKSWFTATETSLQLEIADGDGQIGRSTGVTRRRSGDRLAPGVIRTLRSRVPTLGQLSGRRETGAARATGRRGARRIAARPCYPGAEIQARRDLPHCRVPFLPALPLEMLERRPTLIAAERRVPAAFKSRR